MNAVPDRSAAQASAVQNLDRQLAGAIGIGVLGALLVSDLGAVASSDIDPDAAKLHTTGRSSWHSGSPSSVVRSRSSFRAIDAKRHQVPKQASRHNSASPTFVRASACRLLSPMLPAKFSRDHLASL